MDPTDRDLETDLSALETRLGRLRPGSITLNRDHLLFEAGRAAALGGRRRLLSRGTTIGLGLAVVVLAGSFARERSNRIALETALATTRPAPTWPPSPLVLARNPPPVEPASYRALTRHVLAGEFDSTLNGRSPVGLRDGSTDLVAPIRSRGSLGSIDL